jgi:hypothetical protein
MKAAPIPLTQDEVDAMATGGKAALAVRRRLPAGPAVKAAVPAPKTGKAAPPPLNKKEMAAIRAGRVPPAVRERISVASPETAAASEQSLGPKLAPSAPPPKKK